MFVFRREKRERDRRHKGPSSFFHVPSAASWFDVSAPPPRRDNQRLGARGHFAFITLWVSQSHRYGDTPNERGDKPQGSIVSFADVWNGQASLWFLEYFAYVCQSMQPAQRK